MKRLKAKGIKVVVTTAGAAEADDFFGSEVVRDLDRLKQQCDVIVANRQTRRPGGRQGQGLHARPVRQRLKAARIRMISMTRIQSDLFFRAPPCPTTRYRRPRRKAATRQPIPPSWLLERARAGARRRSGPAHAAEPGLDGRGPRPEPAARRLLGRADAAGLRLVGADPGQHCRPWRAAGARAVLLAFLLGGGLAQVLALVRAAPSRSRAARGVLHSSAARCSTAPRCRRATRWRLSHRIALGLPAAPARPPSGWNCWPGCRRADGQLAHRGRRALAGRRAGRIGTRTGDMAGWRSSCRRAGCATASGYRIGCRCWSSCWLPPPPSAPRKAIPRCWHLQWLLGAVALASAGRRLVGCWLQERGRSMSQSGRKKKPLGHAARDAGRRRRAGLDAAPGRLAAGRRHPRVPPLSGCRCRSGRQPCIAPGRVRAEWHRQLRMGWRRPEA